MKYRLYRGQEVDPHGYLRTGVEAWARIGIYPPPLAGDASDPATVVTMLAWHELRADPPTLLLDDETAVEREAAACAARMRELGIPAPFTPGTTSSTSGHGRE